MASRILIILCCISFVMQLGIGIVVPMLPGYALGLGATATQIGLIFASFSFSRTIFTPLIGALADRSEMKRLILFGIICYALLSIAYVGASIPMHLIWIRALHGIASAFVIPLAMSYVAHIAQEGQEGVYMGSINMALLLGMGAGPLIGGVLTDTLGINTPFYSLAILSGVALVLGTSMLPPMRRQHPKGREGTLKGIIRNPSLLGLLLFRIINALASGNLLAFIPLLAKKVGQSNTEIGILISTNIFITGLLQRPFGRLVSPTNTIRLIMIGSLISAVSLASLPLGRGFFTYLLLGSIMGFGSAISMPAAFVMIMEHGRKLGMSSTMGIFDSAMSLGMILGPLVSGIIMDYVGISYVFYIGGFISLCGMMVFYFLSRRTA
jgi:DHA1 family multidrug resistance protein-like MFS transporter